MDGRAECKHCMPRYAARSSANLQNANPNASFAEVSGAKCPLKRFREGPDGEDVRRVQYQGESINTPEKPDPFPEVKNLLRLVIEY